MHFNSFSFAKPLSLSLSASLYLSLSPSSTFFLSLSCSLSYIYLCFSTTLYITLFLHLLIPPVLNYLLLYSHLSLSILSMFVCTPLLLVLYLILAFCLPLSTFSSLAFYFKPFLFISLSSLPFALYFSIFLPFINYYFSLSLYFYLFSAMSLSISPSLLSLSYLFSFTFLLSIFLYLYLCFSFFSSPSLNLCFHLPCSYLPYLS